MAAVRLCDRLAFAFGWIHPDPAWMARAGHAVRSDGGVWVIDPPDGDGVEERIRELGEPAGVVQLLDRHPRDCAALARRLGVELHVLPFGGVDGAPFEVVSVVRRRHWHEAALWFAAERTLVCADALANAPGYSAPGEAVGVHPMLRLFPPRVLTTFPAEHLLLGHGEGLHGPAARAGIDAAFAAPVRGLPAWGVAQARRVLGLG
ncbi:MAG TPA: hypothetical protein VMT10_11830 [Solirubrobacteraceae bacterium]|nr:hypothetical protein [Solirubrobacteraceae bacterium]